MAANDDKSLLPISGWFISPQDHNNITVKLNCSAPNLQTCEGIFLTPSYVLTASQAIALANTLLTSARYLAFQEQQGVIYDSRPQ
ncbi:hypothetical protein G4923_10620 [Aeromonas rivipollensis]|uniref:Uncharacterized protein n=1 Tax=Aeromonas rivipollensis TaxID=948519 RepID=A0ABX0CZ01_9GAMM|nr:hypothetical protein [Aeromonas rivipollensis]NEX89157.1 hypothetical protein [Aeromonas rivipollensis]NEY05023.1 hypothetical protein [Aeromonas rivipollensis]